MQSVVALGRFKRVDKKKVVGDDDKGSMRCGLTAQCTFHHKMKYRFYALIYHI